MPVDNRYDGRIPEPPYPSAISTWERAAYTRALDLLQRLVQDAVPQAGPGYGERDVNRDDLNAVCSAAEQLLYEARGEA